MKRLFWNRPDYILLFLIFVVGFCLRFYQLGEIPYGLNNDEASIGYNAFSIRETGKDEYGISYPVYFESYGDNKMPVYIYMTSVVMGMLGVNEFSVRLVSAFFGSITIVAVFFLTHIVTRRKSVSLLAAFFLAINPWHMFFSRVGFEVNVATAFLTFGILSFLLAIRYQKYLYIYGILSLICFVISMYTYNATRVLAPVLFLSLFLFYRKDIGKNYVVKIGSFLGLFVLAAFPLVFFSSPGNEMENQESLLISGGQTRAAMVEFRGFLSTLPPLLTKTLFNTPFLVAWQYLKNVASFLSVDFFFVNGPNHPINGITNHGLFYLFEILSIPTGIFLVIKRHIKPLYFIVYWVGVTVLLASITREIPHPTRLYTIVIPLIILSAFGATFFYDLIKNIHNQFVRNLSFIGITAVVTFCFSYYMANYFVYFPLEYAKSWRGEDRELSEYLLSIEPEYDRIIINKDSEFLYASLLFYGQIDPLDVHQHAEYRQDGLLKTMDRFGKFEFREIDWGRDVSLPNTVIVSGKDIPKDERLLKLFQYPMKPVVIYSDGEMTKLDVTDTAYGVFKTQ